MAQGYLSWRDEGYQLMMVGQWKVGDWAVMWNGKTTEPTLITSVERIPGVETPAFKGYDRYCFNGQFYFWSTHAHYVKRPEITVAEPEVGA
jgi:hypothetical protein